ncbi:mitochondrial carrier domain-containing protein [Penicillium angulare]|uniref:mitochondrial carrier domain-containing protein n=1 Tax=Penicillium angulare TaxID=116970 RepID=UPI002541054A|nr:mitochondrial carrier domain-containing protein [Penicillium angulare]KAJ5266836.1 mitochondrial carrier domain-containing protein [Penicillium angulare]
MPTTALSIFVSRDYSLPSQGTKLNARALKGLYQGLGPVLVTSFPGAAVFFFAYEGTQSKIASAANSEAGLSPSALVLTDISASCIAEVAACFIYAPTEMLKQNAQVAMPPPATISSSMPRQKPEALPRESLIRSFKNISDSRTLWRGYWALLAHNLPWTLIQMPLYEALRRYMFCSKPQTKTCSTKNEESSYYKRNDSFKIAINSGLSAAVAGGVTGVLTAPMDIIKTRVNLDVSDQKSSGTKRVMKAAQTIIKTEGLRGLYRGCAINSFMAVVGSGLYFALYEGGKQWLGD